ncbi:PAQR family membrane homeostasis protein TrhA [Haloferula rosea]|uniref:Hemolysin III family protein n=1 Tax=Haloferula rosea TaxID=490093 RepID=A0A934R8M1_9BACT|nr:hemolysin III family protein [Haloferula rosea]MBK1825925.1 hemolysin III family protein [Haloferula rosea]
MSPTYASTTEFIQDRRISPWHTRVDSRIIRPHAPPVAAVPFRPRSPLCDSTAEERASMWSHAFGTALAISSLVIMVWVAGASPIRQVAAWIFGSTLILLYGASTIYHSFTTPRLKSFFQVLDHACIYLLIAGSYTPITLVALQGAWGWSLFGIIWALAFAGVFLKATMRSDRENWWSTGLYLLMGWLVVVAARPLLDSVPGPGIAWLVAGGLCYSLGVVFFVWRSLRFNHAIWHLFVLAGSVCHIVATIFYILR